MRDQRISTFGIDARLWDETGVGRYIRNLVDQLQRIDQKNRYILFVLANNYVKLAGQIENSKIRDRWKIVKADIRWHTIEEQVKFAQILYKENLDLMHFPYFSFPFLYKKKIVITIHDLILHHHATGQATTLPKFVYGAKLLGYKFLLQSGANHAGKIITVSQTTKKAIIEHLHIPEDKVIVTYEGVDQRISNFKSFKPHSNPLLKGERDNRKYFLYVGNAYPHKNLERLVNAFSEMISNLFRINSNKIGLEDVKLIFVGKEDYFYKKLKKRVGQLQCSSSIIFKHSVTDEELANLYQHAVALVLPSLMEGFGLPSVEAMANDCLVLSSDIPVFKEICKDAAVYFNPTSVQDIAEKMTEVYKEQSKFTKNKKIGLELSKNFSWGKMAKETLGIYENCVSV